MREDRVQEGERTEGERTWKREDRGIEQWGEDMGKEQ